MYIKTNWVNDSEPNINEENLNKIETGIYEAHVLAETIADENTLGRIKIGDNLTVDSNGRLNASLDPGTVSAGVKIVRWSE